MAELYLTQPDRRALARDFGVLAAVEHLLNLLSARDFSSSLISSQNTILMGSLRSNPWIGLFENRMNFQTVYQETPAHGVRPGGVPAESQAHGKCAGNFRQRCDLHGSRRPFRNVGRLYPAASPKAGVTARRIDAVF
jgi:hypothetical protein